MAGNKLPKVNSVKLSDSRIRMILKEFEGRTVKIQNAINLSAQRDIDNIKNSKEYNDVIDEISKDRDELRQTIEDLDTEYREADGNLEHFVNAQTRTINADFENAEADLKAKFQKDLNALKDKRDTLLDKIENKQEHKKLSKIVLKIENQSEELNERRKVLDRILDRYQRASGLVNAVDQKITSPAITKMVNFQNQIDDILNRSNIASNTLHDTVDDMKTTLICGGSESGVDILLSLFPTSSSVAKMDFKQIEANINQSSKKIATIES